MLLRVENLKTHFRLENGAIAPAVDGISFELEQGRTLALVGESGCGKSVTAFSIMGLLPDNAFHPPGGAIFLDDQNLLEAPATALRRLRGNRMAMIFQEPMTSLNPLMRIGKQIAEPLRIHRGMSAQKAEHEAVELLKLVGIPSPADRLRDFPHQLSGGMRQRTMIAMALACRPGLLIADEPTTALDVTIQAQILGLMKDLQSEINAAILFITHDLGVVNQLADDICVMYAGKFMETGPRERIFSHRAHPYTRGLFASLPRLDKRLARLSAIPGNVPAPVDFPVGCRFNDRCREVFDRCFREPSSLHEVVPKHHAACHLLEPGTTRRRDEDAWAVHTEAHPETITGAEEPLLRVENLATLFPIQRGILLRTVGHVRAVDGVSFSLPRGQTLALVGESGCGKTTVGLSILRLLKEAQGKIVFAGEDVMAWSKSLLRENRQRLQIVFQDPYSALSPRLTVGRIVGEGLRVHQPRLPPGERARKVDEALREVGLSSADTGRYPHEFSGGQRQRVSIARALVLEPEFLVLDEPTSALDVSVQAQTLNLLRDLQTTRGLTYLFITHDLAVVRHMADLVAVMYLGRIVEQAPRDILLASPRHPYTRSLLRAVPSPETRSPLVRLQGEIPSPAKPPLGCYFHPRCPLYAAAGPDSPLRTLCPRQYPVLEPCDPNHLAACHALRKSSPKNGDGDDERRREES